MSNSQEVIWPSKPRCTQQYDDFKNGYQSGERYMHDAFMKVIEAQKKEIPKCVVCNKNAVVDQSSNGWRCQDHALFGEAQPKIEELRCQLDAWQSVFGTTQLTHAKDRLDVAEKAVKRLEAQLKMVPLDEYTLIRILHEWKYGNSYPDITKAKEDILKFATLVEHPKIVPMDEDLIKYYQSKETQEWMNAPMGKPSLVEQPEMPYEVFNKIETLRASIYSADMSKQDQIIKDLRRQINVIHKRLQEGRKK